jgi:hypothetical protein
VTVPFADRDGGEIEAFIVDRYLESLLARHPADVDGVPIELRATAQRLAAGLPRHHPSFRFEERLALRLAEVAASMRLPVAAGGEGQVVPFRELRPAGSELLRPVEDDDDRDARPLLIGGAVAASALSLAGAWLAWRRRTSPMARAIRAAHSMRQPGAGA